MPLPPVTGAEFRRACAQFATGITITTVLAADGSPQGFTANSFTSVSLDPPLVLVCVDLRSGLLAHLRAQASFGINVLGESQREWSERFARVAPAERFRGVTWHAGVLGVPVLGGALAVLECQLRQEVAAGDHAVLFGEVRRASWHPGRPLLYFGSAYSVLG